ncbi:MAG: amidase [Acidimicrobiia bacterium]|nr:amidase [Acidimicrobiia bacterium]
MTRYPQSAAAIAKAVSAGEIAAVEIVADHLERAQHSQDTLNAYTYLDHDAALDSAARIDATVAAGTDAGPLAGVPIAIKDLIDHAGRPNTAGSSLPPTVPTESATTVTRLERAGAVIIGRTGLHEYAFGFSSENHWFGPVRNPWEPTLAPGGSSGGSAAAVAAQTAAAALGTDTGGSVRVPAALCGVVGLKVTHGRVPLTGVFPLAASLDTVGPLARNVADAAVVYLAIAGHDAEDAWSAPRPVPSPGPPPPLPNITLGVPHPWVDLPQTREVADAFARVLEELADSGARIVNLDLPDLVPAAELELSVYPEVAIVHAERWAQHRDTYGPDVANRLSQVFEIDPLDYVRAQEWRGRVRHTAQHALNHCDALITPAVAASRKPIGQEHISVGTKVGSYRPHLSRFSALVNHTTLPALTVPLDLDGVPPPSLQLIGRQWEEHRLLEIGAALEQAGISGYRTPPHVAS